MNETQGRYETAQARRAIIILDMETITDAVQKKLETIRTLDAEKQSLLDTMKAIEIKTAQAVQEQKDVFKNQEMRDAEVYTRLRADKDHYASKLRLQGIQAQIQELQDGLEVQKYKYRTAQARVSLESLEV
jgi:hypothetical protein